MSRTVEVDEEQLFVELFSARRDLVTMLEELDPGDWDKPTLCEGWRVREVVAHLASAPDLTMLNLVPRLVRARGDVDRLIDEMAHEGGVREPSELLADLRSNIESRRIPPKTTPARMLTDTVIHSLDICHPNGWQIELPADRARLVLSTMV